MKYQGRGIATAACLMCISLAASAQEQSPENAQKFIAQIGSLGQLIYAEADSNQSYNERTYLNDSGDTPVRRTYRKRAQPVLSVASLGRCSTKFTYTDTQVTDLSTGETGPIDSEAYVDWSSVSKVAISGVQVVVTEPVPSDMVEFMGPTTFRRFTLPNEGLAARVGYAMEFLRVSCDRTEGTGF